MVELCLIVVDVKTLKFLCNVEMRVLVGNASLFTSKSHSNETISYVYFLKALSYHRFFLKIVAFPFITFTWKGQIKAMFCFVLFFKNSMPSTTIFS